MSTAQRQKIEKMAAESASLAKRALRKSNELEAMLSLDEYRSGKARSYRSVKELFKKLKRS